METTSNNSTNITTDDIKKLLDGSYFRFQPSPIIINEDKDDEEIEELVSLTNDPEKLMSKIKSLNETEKANQTPDINLIYENFDAFISSYISACVDYKQQKNQCYGNFKILRELCIKNYFYIYNLFKSDCEKNKINNMNISEAYSHYIINNKDKKSILKTPKIETINKEGNTKNYYVFSNCYGDFFSILPALFNDLILSQDNILEEKTIIFLGNVFDLFNDNFLTDIKNIGDKSPEDLINYKIMFSQYNIIIFFYFILYLIYYKNFTIYWVLGDHDLSYGFLYFYFFYLFYLGSLKDIKLNFCFTAKININTKKYTLSSSPIGKKNINNTNLYDKINGVINNSFDDLLKDKISQEDKDLINSNLFNIYDKYSIQPITRNSQSNIKLDRRRDFTQIFNNESNKSYCKTCSTYSNKIDYNQTMNLIDQKLQGICEETNKFDFQNFILEEKINVNIYGKSDKQPEFIFKDNEIIRLDSNNDNKFINLDVDKITYNINQFSFCLDSNFSFYKANNKNKFSDYQKREFNIYQKIYGGSKEITDENYSKLLEIDEEDNQKYKVGYIMYIHDNKLYVANLLTNYKIHRYILYVDIYKTGDNLIELDKLYNVGTQTKPKIAGGKITKPIKNNIRNKYIYNKVLDEEEITWTFVLLLNNLFLTDKAKQEFSPFIYKNTDKTDQSQFEVYYPFNISQNILDDKIFISNIENKETKDLIDNIIKFASEKQISLSDKDNLYKIDEVVNEEIKETDYNNLNIADFYKIMMFYLNEKIKFIGNINYYLFFNLFVQFYFYLYKYYIYEKLEILPYQTSERNKLLTDHNYILSIVLYLVYKQFNEKLNDGETIILNQNLNSNIQSYFKYLSK